LCDDTRKYGQLADGQCRMAIACTLTLRGPVTARKIVVWVLVVFAVWYLLTNPDGAAAFGSHVLNGLKSAGKSLSTFLSQL
jgi:hypothetical protein